MKVIDNFLSEYDFKQIQSVLMGPWFQWYYNDFIVKKGDPFFQFKHTFYNPSLGSPSEHLSLFDICQTKLGVKVLHRIKANLNPKTLFHRGGGYHYDFKDMTTAILYINTNNGYTKIKGYGKVKSVANRMVIFDSNLEHQVVSCTDEKRRVVVNFNYEI